MLTQIVYTSALLTVAITIYGAIYKSSKDYAIGEMYLLLTWIQLVAAEENSLVLESRGQYGKLKREHEGGSA